MIEKLKLKFGSSPTQPNLEIDVNPITIFVGPNNSGKSQVLRDIVTFCHGGNVNGNILERILITAIGDIDNEINKITLRPNDGENISDGTSVIFGKRGIRHNWNREALGNLLTNPYQSFSQFCEVFLRYNVIPLEGSNRLQMINAEGTGDLKQPVNKLQVLFTDEEKRQEVRRIVFDAFKTYFTLDPTSGGQLFIRLSDTEPTAVLERSLTDEALDYHRNNLPIESTSDGVKAFIGLIISIIADDPKIITLDEPEAFLHPSLSFKLGKEIGNILKNDGSKRLFVATHSGNFLMGCIQSGVPINIVWLTYSNRVPTARLLPSEKISKLIKHPLLRSVGTLNGLFYEYVIVTESDSDRAFYQEINERLLQFSPERGIPNCLFLNAQNKQTIHEILKPLREMGIPSVGIADIDVIKEGGANWSNFINCGFLPEVSKQETETSRARIKTKFDEKAIDFKRNGGINVLDAPDREACNNLFERLEEYGVFVVRNGELESWLKPLGATGHSPKWLIEIFEKMGEDSNSTEYLKPDAGDVWDFIGRIRTWFTNPNRKGIPD
jgi:hypothetical protein